jgi:hypothetical protein
VDAPLPPHTNSVHPSNRRPKCTDAEEAGFITRWLGFLFSFLLPLRRCFPRSKAMADQSGISRGRIVVISPPRTGVRCCLSSHRTPTNFNRSKAHG